MVENQMSRGEITWVDILKMLAKKAKLIAWITLLALVLGAAAGVGVAMISNATYGTQVEFYISSEERNSYILSLISSDSFSEKLLLDENGLPESDKGSNAYNEALAAKEAVDAKREEMEDLEDKIKFYPTEKDKAQREYNTAKAVYDDLKKSWETYMNVQFDGFLTEQDFEDIADLKKELAVAKAAQDKASEALKSLQDEMQDSDRKRLELQDEMKELVGEKKKAYDIALAEFRSNPDNIEKTKNIKKYVTYYIEKTEKDNKINESSAQLQVSIAVKFDKEFAQELLDKIALNLPSFVEESVIAEGDERETQCEYLSVFGSVDVVDYKNPIVEAAKFGGIAAAATVLVGCLAVIVTEMFKVTDAARLAAPAEQLAIDKADEESEEEAE